MENEPHVLQIDIPEGALVSGYVAAISYVDKEGVTRFTIRKTEGTTNDVAMAWSRLMEEFFKTLSMRELFN